LLDNAKTRNPVGLNIDGMIDRKVMLDRREDASVIDTEISEGQLSLQCFVDVSGLLGWAIGKQ